MTLKSRLLTGSIVAGALAAISGCAALGIGGTADPRWADYKEWAVVTNGETGDPTGFIGNVHRGPEGYRNVLVNDLALETINSSDAGRKFPVGSVIVKEQYKSQAAWESGKGAAVTVSVKVDEDKWGWADSLTDKAGDSAFCQGCHTIAAAHDLMFTGGGYAK